MSLSRFLDIKSHMSRMLIHDKKRLAYTSSNFNSYHIEKSDKVITISALTDDVMIDRFSKTTTNGTIDCNAFSNSRHSMMIWCSSSSPRLTENGISTESSLIYIDQWTSLKDGISE